jgi:hypothetical protein
MMKYMLLFCFKHQILNAETNCKLLFTSYTQIDIIHVLFLSQLQRISAFSSYSITPDPTVSNFLFYFPYFGVVHVLLENS